MKPDCPIPQWEHSFATEYCAQIKQLGKMWRKSTGFGNKTLKHFRGVAFNLCVTVKTVWFPGCAGTNHEDCKKFLFSILNDWKEAYKADKIKEYPLAYLVGMVRKSVREGDGYFEALKRRKETVWKKSHLTLLGDFLPQELVQQKRDQLPPGVRWWVLKRDNFRCRYCGRDVNNGVKLHVDHITPLSKGGTNYEDNLITSCEDCNIGKGATEFEHLVIKKGDARQDKGDQCGA